MPLSDRVVLSVDDDETNQLILQSFLHGAGCKVVPVYSGQECLDYLDLSFSGIPPDTHLIPDIVLLDVIMPGIDGFVTCREIRSRFPSTLPVIMLTAKVSKADSIKCLNDCLANDYFSKPFDRALMLCKMEVLISISKSVIAEQSSRTVSSIPASRFRGASLPKDHTVAILIKNIDDMALLNGLTQTAWECQFGQCIVTASTCRELISTAGRFPSAIGYTLDESPPVCAGTTKGLFMTEKFYKLLALETPHSHTIDAGLAFERSCLKLLQFRLGKANAFKSDFIKQLEQITE